MQTCCGRPDVRNGECASCRCPTPDEIRLRTEAIRRTWDNATFRERAGHRTFGFVVSRDHWRETVVGRRERAVRRLFDDVLQAVGVPVPDGAALRA